MDSQLQQKREVNGGTPFAEARGSAQHPICKDCIHRWPQDGAPPYHPDSWCYMFRTGEHVDAQGYCGQFRISPDVPNAIAAKSD